MNTEKLEWLKKRDCFSIENNFIKYSAIKSRLIYGDIEKPAPFITVFMPTYKRPDVIKNAIDSVLEQKYFNDFELLIVDNEAFDGETSETEKVIKEYNSDKIVYYRNEKNIGMYANWNRCLELARSEWVTMIHDDDLFVENHLFTMTKLIREHKEITFLSLKANEVSLARSPQYDFKNLTQEVAEIGDTLKFYDFRTYNFRFSAHLLGAVFLRKNAIDLGGFYTEGMFNEDYYFTAKYAYHFGVYEVDAKLYVYIYEMNMSLKSSIWHDELAYEYYLMRYISRKRFFLLRPLLYAVVKYRILYTMKGFNEGKPPLTAKCNIDKKSLLITCGHKRGNANFFTISFTRVMGKILETAVRLSNRKHDLKI
ncbi:MAG: glycosyltransferase family 2 protein [Eubacteriaceae bacterium]|nr:glycosyltransferase family 2 protein [Eubacteriaceae bacterium]